MRISTFTLVDRLGRVRRLSGGLRVGGMSVPCRRHEY